MTDSQDKGEAQVVQGDKLETTMLGKHTDYVSVYTPSLLCPISRAESRQSLGLSEGEELPFLGVDIWTAFELSWLNAKGLPQVAVAEFHFPCTSPNIVESKSFKLYLNSFNQTVFDNFNDVARTLETDLSTAAGAPVMVSLERLSQYAARGVGHFTGECLDELDVEIEHYHPAPELLGVSASSDVVAKSLYSDLLKTNCPVTGQPDWASVFIQYRGREIDQESLLKYLVSFREHQDFHEHCLERIYMDIMERCQPESLQVYARYTRRGGLDINPFRSSEGVQADDIRLARQ
ncbi:MAG: NADPH-dependent 7-cyano-7-deazaguanine reductase QueF [Candidatus Pelagadaptatus aseana]